MPSPPPSPIKTSELSKSYGSNLALNALSLEIHDGEIFGFLGPNGAGKTTTIRLLLGLIRASSGSASVFSLDAWNQSQQIHQDLGYLPGEVRLYDYLTGAEFIRLVCELRGKDCGAYAYKLAERLALDLSKRIRAYSRGMKQKLGLIQALMHSPRLVILDEPTTGLDPLMQHEVYDMLKERRDRGVTVFFSTHVLSEVEKVCDRVGIIRRGRLVDVETIEAFRQRSVRRAEVEFADGQKVPDTLQLENIRLAGKKGARYLFTITGNMDGFIKWLAEFSVREVIIEPPGVEDVFFEYYQDHEGSDLEGGE